jgi:glycosyltransferase involved in cell wall biosynthesis
MVGRPGNSRRYEELHKHISEIPNLKYLGERSIEEVNQLLAESHIFVNTSIAEGFANTFIQAWMRKVPVVSVDADIDGLLRRQEFGLLGGSYEGMRDSVLNLIENDTRRESMGQEAKDYAFKYYSNKNIDMLLDIMRQEDS